MILLDTDHISLLEWGDNESSSVLRTRLAASDDPEISTTIISYEEQMRGWMAVLSKAQTTESQVHAYQRLADHLENYRLIPVQPFDKSSAEVFTNLRRDRIRIGTMDLRIASIAIANKAILLIRNSADFGKVPGLRFEN
ncbi:MAG: type II toxin-antitoxin system VapC family toxin [Planctomycetota bacterium]|nr:type II toxin-antitoxin system VapC family toxin [Planctomycetota bacterium]MDA0921603.1 type II toxin-antitoxin system VapC family toxin [Planctomycetota bacterium]